MSTAIVSKGEKTKELYAFFLQKPQKGVNLYVEKSQKRVRRMREKSQKRVKWSGYETKDISATA